MSKQRIMRLFTLGFGMLLALASSNIAADDIDIFTTSAGNYDNPNLLIVLDNTSNWSRNSQQWPSGTQGQSEVAAIKTVIDTLGDTINVGLLEFVTGGSAGDDGGYVRFAVKPMNTANKSAFSTILTTMYNRITDPLEKRNSNTPYGNLMYDTYNYLSGGLSHSPAATADTATPPDPDGYTTQYTRFRSPLSTASSCAKTFIVVIGNADSNGPTVDSSDNTTALANLGGSTAQIPLPDFTMTTTTAHSNLGYTSQCYSPASACSTTDYTTQCANYSSCSCSTTDSTTALGTCSSGTRYSVLDTVTTATTTESPVVTANSDTGTVTGCLNSLPTAAQTCPATATSTPVVVGNTSTKVTTSWASCLAYGAGAASSCNGSKKIYNIKGTKTENTITTTTTSATPNPLGYTQQCYSSSGSCSTSDYSATCSQSGHSCACGTPTSTTAGSCASGARYQVVGDTVSTTATPSPTYSSSTSIYNIDEWARFLHQSGINVGGGQRSIATFTIDVYHAQQNNIQTSLLLSTATAGGGKYFAATSQEALVAALTKVVQEVQSVNSTFASTSLPVNATNRTQNENQVFIGMFRPDPTANPRWYGNMKRYQLISSSSGGVELGDATGAQAVNSATGFLTDCAVSFWTSTSSNYWATVSTSPPAAGRCDPTAVSYSDSPDGPFVEKGAAAEVIRKGNNPPTTDTSPTWGVNRNILTLSGSSLVPFNAANSSLSTDLVDFTTGKDINDENANALVTDTRASLHGDVIHSRPLPLNYGGSTGVTAFYGANDGMLRAVDASTGKERWAFVAPEFFSRLDRLRTNSPMALYANAVTTGITPTPTPKDYFFDGSIGVYQNASNSSVWIYPSMRRGGRMIYALNVSDPDSPVFKWKAGCPNLTNDTGCTTDMGEIGQTWAMPSVAFIAGYTTDPVVIINGGYDSCEDANSGSPSCGSAKGRKVFILNANTGALLKTLDTDRSVVGDPALVDINSDSKADYAYIADTGGSLYRIDFLNSPTAQVPLSSSEWNIHKIASTSGGYRKFLFAPALLPAANNKVYLAIGSGDREHPLQSQYPYGITNRFYVYADDLTSTSSTPVTSLDDTSVMYDYSSSNSCSNTNILPSSTYKGWFMNLNANGAGEQAVTSTVIVAGLASFSTNRPIPATTGSCSTSLGEARGYFVNLLNGAGAVGVTGSCGGQRSGVFVGGGLPPSPVIATVVVGGKTQTVLIGAVQRLNSSGSSSINAQNIAPTITSTRKRTYWRKDGEE